MAGRRACFGARGGSLLVGIVVALVAVILPASGDTPESGSNPSIAVTVAPDDFLSDGAAVLVTGTGFAPNTAGQIDQCTADPSGRLCDGAVAATFVTTAAGTIPPTSVVVKRVIDPVGPSTVNCGITMCALVASAGAGVSQHHISFAGAGTVVPTTSSSTTSSSTTSSTSTTPPPTTTPTTPTTTLPPGLGALCQTLQALAAAIPFLAEILRSLAVALRCPAAG